MRIPGEQDAGTQSDEPSREHPDAVEDLGWIAGTAAVIFAGDPSSHPPGSTRWAPRTGGDVSDVVSLLTARTSSARQGTPPASAGLVLTEEADIDRLRALRARVRADLDHRKATRSRTA